MALAVPSAVFEAPPFREFPPKSDRARLETYARNDRLFRGDHLNGLRGPNGEFDVDPGTAPIYVSAHVTKPIITVSSDLLFGEPISFEYPDDASERAREAVDDIWQRSDGGRLMYEASLDTSVWGDGVFTLERGEDGLARIRSVPADQWFPEVDPDDVRKVRAHRIAWMRTIIDERGREVDLLRVIEHRIGLVRNRLFRMSGTEITGEAGDSEWRALYGDAVPPAEVETGVDDFLVFHVPNTRTSTDLFGRSDYEGLEPLIASLNAKLTQVDAIIEKHADPILGLPSEAYQILRAIYGDRIPKRKIQVVSLGENGEKPEYVTWDGNLRDALEYVDRVIRLLALASETAPQLLNLDSFGGDVSGRALRIMLLRTLAKVARKRRYYDDVIPRILFAAQQLEGVPDPVMVSVSWPDGLPLDGREAIETAALRINAGLSSRVREIERLEEVSREDAQRILDEISREDDVSRTNDAVARDTARKTPIVVDLGLPSQQGAK